MVRSLPLRREAGRSLSSPLEEGHYTRELSRLTGLDVQENQARRILPELRGRLESAELIHELLEHRYYLSEDVGYGVDDETALKSYLESVLPFRPYERVLKAGEDEADGSVRGPGRDRTCDQGIMSPPL